MSIPEKNVGDYSRLHNCHCAVNRLEPRMEDRALGFSGLGEYEEYRSSGFGSFRKIGVPFFGFHIRRILQCRVLY